MPFSYESIYNRYFTDALNTIKQYRHSWDYSLRSTWVWPRIEYGKLWTSDVYTFDYVIKRSDETTRDMLLKMFIEMMSHRDPSSIVIPICGNEYIEYSACGVNTSHKAVVPAKHEYYAVATSVQNKKILFVFKEFGIENRLPCSIIAQIVKEHNLQGYMYISLVDDCAYAEVINHNNNESDPSRGTKLYPLPLFFRLLFGSAEFTIFSKYYLDFQKSISTYFGLSVVKSLRPNVLFSYRRQVRDAISMFDYLGTLSLFSLRTLSEEQKSIIDNQFIQKGFIYALTSFHPYSKCFITAEWLYSSLHDSSDSIDLTVISMGYFKSLEQFLYQWIGQHTSNKDGKRREYAFRDDEWLELTDDRYVSRKKDMTLGGLAKFLKNYRNRDLFTSLINQETYDIIRDILSKVTAQRNGYFHKDNIVDWAEVEKDRNITFLIFYFLLGTLQLSDTDITALGIDDSFCPSAADKACIYINSLSVSNNDQNIKMILYMSENALIEDFWFPCEDRNVKYNEFGDPQHSGIYFRRMSDDVCDAVFRSKDELPDSIYEGILQINSQLPISITPSGPVRQIWGNNTFNIG